MKNSDMTDKEYYAQRLLSVSSVRLFAQNPARALDDWNGVYDWFQKKDELFVGQFVHSCAQDFLTGTDKNLEKFKASTPELFAKTGKKGLLAKYARAETMAKVLTNSDIVRWLKDKYDESQKENHIEVWVETALTGEVDGIKFRGKPDVLVIDHEAKTIHMFDFKTSAKYDTSGFDWGENIDGERSYSNVAWHVEKLFPWQAGTYRELMRQAGYADYDFVYRYIVVTKEEEPRLDIWDITDKAMTVGYENFVINLAMAHRYITGEITPPVIADNSPWWNLRTQKAGNLLLADIEE